ncbi:family 43 glycosylhydrolase [Bacteroidales bacterium OttesenSCG-928-J19]|nr:family 43 glycosylhydrolase [Bacteroidales bacterium OttesenSCG-928-J19]
MAELSVIHNGIPWFDDRGKIVNAHGACIVEENGRYYLFGEYKSNGVNAFYGFSCYSSDDLSNWTFERIVLGVQPEGLLGPDRIGERPKVMKCPSTGEYIMYMHCDDLKYKDQYVGYASCSTIDGEYTFHGALLLDGKPIRRWDLGTFQDTDGVGYLLIHHGGIYRLSEDYRSIEKQVVDKISEAGESPAMMKKGGVYYLLSSGLTSWERNDNKYHTAPSIEGPWTAQGLFCPEGTLTYNSQCTFVLPVQRGDDMMYMYMGDRWSFPHQSDAATYVWLPLDAENGKLTISEYWEAWDFKTVKEVDPVDRWKTIPYKKIRLSGKKDWDKANQQLSSNTKDSYLIIPFEGTRVAVSGESNQAGAYAIVSILDEKGELLYSSSVDFYSKVANRSIRFMSPKLKKGKYTLKIEVTGIMSEWFKKDGTRFGSQDTFVRVNQVLVSQ